MKIIQVNLGNWGSTGKIMLSLKDVAEQRGHEVFCAFPDSNYLIKNKIKKNDILIGNRVLRKLNLQLAKFTGYMDCFSIVTTKIFLNKLDKIKPDIIHIHNLHTNYLNIKMFFKYINKNNIKVIWTLHDCWSFTGFCTYFTWFKCEEWKHGCKKCKNIKRINYPKSYINKARKLYILKQKYFGSVKNLTIITPSKWLFNLVKQSHLKNYPSKVIYNGIDLSVFYPRKDDLIYTKYNIPKDKKIILSVSFGWPEYKGYFYIEKLRMLLSDDYLILVVGQEKRYEKKGIQCIEKTYNQDDLAKIYSIANVFFNPTLQEVLGMVNIEALACGTPVVAFNTGGVPEIVDRYCGRIIESKDMEEVRKNIEYFCNYGDSAFLANACVNRAKTFNEKDKYKEYLELYENI